MTRPFRTVQVRVLITPEDPSMPLTNGQTFAGYTIIRLLGSGGMGEVYLVAASSAAPPRGAEGSAP